MDDLKPIQFLEFLESIDGDPQEKIIRSFMVRNFTKPKSLSHFAKNDNEPGKLMLLDLLDDGLIEADKVGIQHICNKDWTDPRGKKEFQQWFDTLDIKAKITTKGLNKLKEYRTTTHLITDTLKSNQETTDAVNKTAASIKKSTDYQVIFSLISTLAIVATAVIAFLALRKSEPISLKHIDTLLQKQEIILDSIRQSQQGIDRSLKTATKKGHDTIPIKVLKP